MRLPSRYGEECLRFELRVSSYRKLWDKDYRFWWFAEYAHEVGFQVERCTQSFLVGSLLEK